MSDTPENTNAAEAAETPVETTPTPETPVEPTAETPTPEANPAEEDAKTAVDQNAVGPAFTLEDITPPTREEEVELANLLSDAEQLNGVSAEESSRRTKLIFKTQANRLKDLATDDVIDENADANYEALALKNWAAWLK